MSDQTSIEWTATRHADGTITKGSTWNPLRGTAGRHTCARISSGCQNCYAATMNRRGLMGTAALDYGVGETLNDPARLDENALLQPLHWKAPRKVFVCSMTDLFGTWVTAEWIARIISVMAECRQHTFIVLTKRPTRMRDMLSTLAHNVEVAYLPKFWPLPNVWVGVTIESDQFAWRADRLRQTPAAVRWISAEPLLSGLPSLNLAGIDWLVTGGESGPKARPMHPQWARDLRDRCLANGTAIFHKQNGEFEPDWQEPYPDETWTDDETDRSRDQLIDMNGRDCMNWTGPDQVKPFALLRRVGRKSAGRLLDGREWNEYPESQAVAAGAS